MKFIITLKTIGIAVLVLLNLSEPVIAQNFSFKNYGTEYGIPNNFVYAINQSSDGFLWVGTGNGIARFDGYDYYPVHYPDSVDSRNPSVSFRDKRGTIWFGCSDGAVFYTNNNSLKALSLGNSRSISQIFEGPDSAIYILPQGKAIYRIDTSDPEHFLKFNISEDYVMFSAAFAETGRLLIGTQGSILVCSVAQDSVTVMNKIEGFDYSGINSIQGTGMPGHFLAGTEDNGFFSLDLTSPSPVPVRFKNHPEWSGVNVRSIFRDQENKILVSTFGSGVIELSLDDQGSPVQVHTYNTATGLTSNDVELVFRDSEGNYWFGLFGEGISMLASSAFSYFSPGKNISENNILFIGTLDDHNYILGTPSGFHVFDPETEKTKSFTNLVSGTGAQITSYFIDATRNLWIGSAGKGLFVRTPDGSLRQFYRSGDSGADRINDIQIDNTNIWLATTNGVIVLDRQNGKLKASINIDNGLPHNSINKILLDDGKALIGTESDRVYQIDRDFSITAIGCTMGGSSINKIVALSRSSNGTIWAATNGNGVFSCHNDSVASLNRSSGLSSNYCYSIFADSENNIWVGHSKGFSRFDSESAIIKTYGTDYAKSGVCNPEAIFESADKKIFIGTTEGVIVYDSRKDNRKSEPPYNNITSIVINNVEYSYAPVINLPYGKYSIFIKYSGINFSDPEKVFYQTYLENYDLEPSGMSLSREAKYILADGKYKFSLVSVDENGYSRDPVNLSIIIDRPVYKKWWFILIMVVVLTGIVITIIRIREKAQKKIRSYLEDELEKRTSVIMKQKGEIEIQNIEITDSINYAKRIQSSILPDIGKLKESFRDAFILFHPRDIVSGDFYWFDKIDDDRFIIVCADSTGHGVPGAFMSMIGSTLLQDIVTRKKISKPSQILTLLDKQIFSTLNQNVDLGVSNDGMDMVICEFNIKSRHVRFSSAMRPIILVMSGESHYIKGNRSSVGGESVIEKYFIDQEYYLNEGDTLYLFSDGLPDQFGGADGKKMKIARLKKIIDQVSKLPMREQEKAMSDFFNEWRGNHEQVDDILLMGVRL